ncbi:hypothetical protein ACFB49_29860 [Sphingomonas sp. DBB INV C78]|uniref:DUF5818 domain-containing protein n=1 Tax=Sphingomonas sp. DBB INV C78 TaxID=3349434 RepID=UPI0036D23A46
MRSLPIDETGLLLREQGLAFKRDRGGQWRLSVRRIPIELIGSRVRVVGRTTDADSVEVRHIERC